ncbi:hypothetical protein BD310DRAFT_180556 [Dichomitus squalens]|uniref:Uncharacterized protein n=1 Tax=Dichomitus squalens TaxID=114155 RepID=A0A4Q9PEI1_9APHY|nr:hypothetical protein BD310DRAFT_180556 [Dichomitus squalens]
MFGETRMKGEDLLERWIVSWDESGLGIGPGFSGVRDTILSLSPGPMRPQYRTCWRMYLSTLALLTRPDSSFTPHPRLSSDHFTFMAIALDTASSRPPKQVNLVQYLQRGYSGMQLECFDILQTGRVARVVARRRSGMRPCFSTTRTRECGPSRRQTLRTCANVTARGISQPCCHWLGRQSSGRAGRDILGL